MSISGNNTKKNGYAKYNPFAFVRRTLKKRRNAKQEKKLDAFNIIDIKVTKIITEINNLISMLDKTKIYIIPGYIEEAGANNLIAVTKNNGTYTPEPNKMEIKDMNISNPENNYTDIERFDMIDKLFTELENIKVENINDKYFSKIHEKILSINIDYRKNNPIYLYKNGNVYQNNKIKNVDIYIIYNFTSEKYKKCIKKWDEKAIEVYGDTYNEVLVTIDDNFFHHNIYKKNLLKVIAADTIYSSKFLVYYSTYSMTPTLFKILFDVIKKWIEQKINQDNQDNKKKNTNMNLYKEIFKAWKKREMSIETKWYNFKGKKKISNSYKNNRVKSEFNAIFSNTKFKQNP